MPDFLDRLGEQLHAAQQTTSDAARDPAGARRRLRVGRRGLLIAGAALAVGAPASVAVVSVWSPDLQRDGIDKPVSTDSSPVSVDVTSALAVLRRSQTPADRAGAQPLLKAIGAGNQVDGVQTGAIRMVAPGWALVPAKNVRTGPDTSAADQLCLTNGLSNACATALNVTTNGLTLLSASSTGTNLTGIVPDSVARVRFTPQGGQTVEVGVSSNYFRLSTPQTRTSPPTTRVDGTPAPGVPLPAAGNVTWLRADGHQTAPATQPIPE